VHRADQAEEDPANHVDGEASAAHEDDPHDPNAGKPRDEIDDKIALIGGRRPFDKIGHLFLPIEATAVLGFPTLARRPFGDGGK